jgi:hypothetical protein
MSTAPAGLSSAGRLLSLVGLPPIRGPFPPKPLGLSLSIDRTVVRRSRGGEPETNFGDVVLVAGLGGERSPAGRRCPMTHQVVPHLRQVGFRQRFQLDRGEQVLPDLEHLGVGSLHPL